MFNFRTPFPVTENDIIHCVLILPGGLCPPISPHAPARFNHNHTSSECDKPIDVDTSRHPSTRHPYPVLSALPPSHLYWLIMQLRKFMSLKQLVKISFMSRYVCICNCYYSRRRQLREYCDEWRLCDSVILSVCPSVCLSAR